MFSTTLMIQSEISAMQWVRALCIHDMYIHNNSESFSCNNLHSVVILKWITICKYITIYLQLDWVQIHSVDLWLLLFSSQGLQRYYMLLFSYCFHIYRVHISFCLPDRLNILHWTYFYSCFFCAFAPMQSNE